MKKNILNHALLIATLASAVAFAPIVSAAPPTPVAEMSKKELKTYKRDTNAIAFDTKLNKDKANNLEWLESPVMNDPSTPNLRHYFRAAIRDGKLVTIQVIVSQVQFGFTEYDRKSMDYTSIKLGDRLLPTEAGEPLRDPAQNAITQISAATITEQTLRDHAETGMHLMAKNTYGDTEVPIKPSHVTGFLRRLDGVLKKSK